MQTFIKLPAVYTDHGILPEHLVPVEYKGNEYYRLICDFNGVEDDSEDAFREYNNEFNCSI